jgi:hypothetical protein
MALVRCSCIVGLLASTDGHGALAVDLKVLDPDCGYVVHRLGAELTGIATGLGPDDLRG